MWDLWHRDNFINISFDILMISFIILREKINGKHYTLTVQNYSTSISVRTLKAKKYITRIKWNESYSEVVLICQKSQAVKQM